MLGASRASVSGDRMSVLIYDGLAKMGLKAVPTMEVRSKTVVATFYPEGVDDAQFRKSMAHDKGVVIAGGFGMFAGKVFRIGCMGQIKEEYVKKTLAAVSDTLSKFQKR